MRTVSTVFCWITFGISTLVSFIYVIVISATASLGFAYEGSGTLAAWVIVIIWIVWVAAIAIQIAILRWRNKCLDNGEKGGCGVVTLLFVSLIGGILTLCIPESEINPVRLTPRVLKTSNGYSRAVSPLDRAQKISVYQEQLNKGIITRAEYDAKVAALDGTPAPRKPTENEKIELIQKYKKLLDDGVITQEEFDKKKTELLK